MLYGQERRRKDERVDVRVDAETKRVLDELVALYRSNRSHIVRLAVAELGQRRGLDRTTELRSREEKPQ